MLPGTLLIAVLVAVPALVSLSYPIHIAVATRRGPRRKPRRAPPRVGIVVPLRGEEEGLRANLSAWIAQRAPGGIRLVFVAEDAADEGLATARSLAPASDHVDIVVSGPAGADLGKAHNLAAGLERLDADVVVLADSDARPPDPGFVARLVEPLEDPKVGLVTCVPSYRDAGDLGAGLVAAMINTEVAGLFGLLAAWNRLAHANGTCLALRANALRAAGGMSRLRRRLLMDSALARRVVDRGFRVELHREPVPVHRARVRLSECWSQARRWHVAMRFGLPVARYFAVGWLKAGTPVAALAFVAAPHAAFGAVLVGSAAARIVAAALVSRLFLRDRAAAWVLLLTPLADSFAALAWLGSFASPAVSWRGVRYRVGPGAVVSPRGAAPDPVGEIAAPGTCSTRRSAS